MIALPLLAAAVYATATVVLPAVGVPIVGAPGNVYGVTAPEAPDAVPVPAAFVAVTVNVYCVPLVSPVTVSEVTLVPVVVKLPGDDVAV